MYDIVEVVDTFIVPLSVTDHAVPDGNPDSVNVILNITCEKISLTAEDFPFIVKLP